MKKYGLIGNRIEYSFSPQIHQFFFDKYGIQGTYERLDAKDNFNALITQLKASDFLGFNVTVPYKVKIIPFLNELSPEAERVGSVNTITVKNGKWYGDNTDVSGFGSAMRYEGVKVNGKSSLVIGAGGAARAIVYSLIKEGAKSILIYNRTRAHTNELMIEVKNKFNYQSVMSIFDYHGLIVDTAINTTPLGGANHVDALSINSHSFSVKNIVDINYTPERSPAIEMANNLGLFATNGFSMLVCQALHAQQIWQDKELNSEEIEAFINETKCQLYK